MNKFKNFYRDLSIRHKIILIYLPLSLIPLLLFAYISTRVYEGSIVERTLVTTADDQKLITNQIENYLNDLSDSATMLTININNVTRSYNQGTSKESLTIFNAISNELSYSKLVFPIIDSIAYIDTDSLLYTSDRNLGPLTNQDLLVSMIEVLDQTTGTDHWFPMTRRDFLVTPNNETVLTLGKKVIEIDTGKTLGYLFINLSAKELINAITYNDTEYIIIDNLNNIIASTSYFEMLTPYNDHPFHAYIGNGVPTQKVITADHRSKQIMTASTFNNGQWTIIGKANLAYLTSDLDRINLFIYIILIVILMIIILSLNLLSSVLTRPLEGLTKHMKKLSGSNFHDLYTYDSKDEIGTLTEGFNHMQRDIQNLLTKVEEEQKSKREYELALIQEQIKPHFLYNCLDAIYALSMMGRQKDAAKTTKALADYYRLSLSKGHDVISLQDEIANVTNYLELQKIRYADVFDYEIDMNPAYLQKKILKLTLQPIVENAIYHGLKPSAEMGHIRIKGYHDKNKLYIAISDNGEGIDISVMETLLTKPSKEKHFGLYNVQDRIQLFFGAEYGVKIDSVKDVGTTVTLSLPYKEESTND